MSTNHCDTSRPEPLTTTTKHPHLSVVQVFKDLPTRGKERIKLLSCFADSLLRSGSRAL
jgi:hypothetical protein